MEYLFIYLLQMADNLNALQEFIYILLGISIFTYIFIYIMIVTDSYYEEKLRQKKFVRSIKKFYITCISILIIVSFIPTKQTLLLVGGTYLGKKAINTVITDKKIEKVNTIIGLELDKRIKELKGGN